MLGARARNRAPCTPGFYRPSQCCCSHSRSCSRVTLSRSRKLTDLPNSCFVLQFSGHGAISQLRRLQFVLRLGEHACVPTCFIRFPKVLLRSSNMVYTFTTANTGDVTVEVIGLSSPPQPQCGMHCSQDVLPLHGGFHLLASPVHRHARGSTVPQGDRLRDRLSVCSSSLLSLAAFCQDVVLDGVRDNLVEYNQRRSAPNATGHENPYGPSATLRTERKRWRTTTFRA